MSLETKKAFLSSVSLSSGELSLSGVLSAPQGPTCAPVPPGSHSSLPASTTLGQAMLQAEETQPCYHILEELGICDTGGHRREEMMECGRRWNWWAVMRNAWVRILSAAGLGFRPSCKVHL